MKFVIKKYLLTTASLFVVTVLIDVLDVNGGWKGLFSSSVMLAILLHVVKPLINIIMFPVNLLTLNLSGWIIQITIFYLWTIIGNTTVSNWQFAGINLGSIIISPAILVQWQVIILSAVSFIFIYKFLEWIFR